MLNLNGECGTVIAPGELVEGFTFEPRCLVLVIAADHERQMFDEMAAAGRILSDPFVRHAPAQTSAAPTDRGAPRGHRQEISVNFTLATGAAPDVKTVSTNCGNSRVLMANHALDLVGQAERDELALVRDELAVQSDVLDFWQGVARSRAMVSIDPTTGFATLLPPSPSPPPPPPPAPENAPPSQPADMGNEVEMQRVEDRITALEARRDALVSTLRACHVEDRASHVVCGQTANEAPDQHTRLPPTHYTLDGNGHCFSTLRKCQRVQAPDPWVALDGVKCRGYATRQARELDFCGYW